MFFPSLCRRRLALHHHRHQVKTQWVLYLRWRLTGGGSSEVGLRRHLWSFRWTNRRAACLFTARLLFVLSFSRSYFNRVFYWTSRCRVCASRPLITCRKHILLWWMQVSDIIWHVIRGDESLSAHCHGDDGSDGDVRPGFCVSDVSSASDRSKLQTFLIWWLKYLFLYTYTSVIVEYLYL